MTKPSPTDATTKLDAARTSVRDHIKDLIDWRSSMTLRGNETAANKALSHFNELREVSDQLDSLVRTWNELIIKQQGPITPTPVKAPEVPPEPKPATKRAFHNKGPASRLKITLADGAVISETHSAATLVNFVTMVGIERVVPLGIMVNGQPFVSNVPLPKYERGAISWKPVGDYYIETNSSTETKRKIIEQISKEFGMSVSVDIVKSKHADGVKGKGTSLDVQVTQKK
jgi:hypothetical protein